MSGSSISTFTVIALLIFAFIMTSVIYAPLFSTNSFLNNTYETINTYTDKSIGIERYVTNLYKDISFEEVKIYEDINKKYDLLEIDNTTHLKSNDYIIENYSKRDFLLNNNTYIEVSTNHFMNNEEFSSGFDINILDPNGKIIGSIDEENNYLNIDNIGNNYGVYQLEILPNNATVLITLQYKIIEERIVLIKNQNLTLKIENSFPINKIHKIKVAE